MSIREQLVQLREQRNQALALLSGILVEIEKFKLKFEIFQGMLGPKKSYRKGLNMQEKYNQLVDQKDRLDKIIPAFDYKILELLNDLKFEREFVPSEGGFAW